MHFRKMVLVIFTVFARKPFQYVGKVISLMHVIGNVA